MTSNSPDASETGRGCGACRAARAALHLMDAAAQDRSQNQDRSPMFDVATANAEMAAAIAKARATLPAFWASYEAPKAIGNRPFPQGALCDPQE